MIDKNEQVKQALIRAGFKDWTALSKEEVRRRLDASRDIALAKYQQSCAAVASNR